MKKIISLILAVLCLFAFVSCGEEACEKHIDVDVDGKCDVCQADYTCPGHLDADENGICDECAAPYLSDELDLNTPEGALAVLIRCYENSKPLKVETETHRVVGEEAYNKDGKPIHYELNGLYTLIVGGTRDGKVATVYTEVYDELRSVDDGVDEIVGQIKTVEYKKEFVAGSGVRENGGDWDKKGTNFAPSAGSISLGITEDNIEHIEFEYAQYNNTVSFTVPKNKLKAVFGETDGVVNIDSDTAVKVTITNNGAVVTSVALTYSVLADKDVPKQSVTVVTKYSYEIQPLITIE